MARLDRKKLGILLGSMAIAALPTPEVEAVVLESEPNNTLSAPMSLTSPTGSSSWNGCT